MAYMPTRINWLSFQITRVVNGSLNSAVQDDSRHKQVRVRDIVNTTPSDKIRPPECLPRQLHLSINNATTSPPSSHFSLILACACSPSTTLSLPALIPHNTIADEHEHSESDNGESHNLRPHLQRTSQPQLLPHPRRAKTLHTQHLKPPKLDPS